MSDITVYVGNVEYSPRDDYGIELTFTRAGDWRLWNTWGKKFSDYSLIGEQFGRKPFCLVIDENVICGSIPKEIVRKKFIGWDGYLQVTP